MNSLPKFLIKTCMSLVVVLMILGQVAAREPVRLSERVDDYFTGEHFIKVRKLLNIGEKYRNYKLKEVILFAETDYGKGRATLMVNDEACGRPQVVGQYMDRYVFRSRPGQDKFGQDIRRLQIKLRGRFWVEKVVARLERPGGGFEHVQIVKKQLYKYYDGKSIIPVRRTLSIGQDYRGRKVKFVTLVASSEGSRPGRATLLINERPVGRTQTLGYYEKKLRFELPEYNNVIGEDIRTIKIELRGDIYTEELAIGLLKKHGGGDEDTIDKRMNKRLMDGAEVPFRELLQFSPQDSRKRTRSVTFSVAGRREGSSLEVCSRRTGCFDRKHVPIQKSTIRFRIDSTRLGDLYIRVQGRILISRMIVKLDRRSRR